MQRFQTQFAIIATLLVLGMLLLFCGYVVIAEGAHPRIFQILVPLCLINLGIAFYLGHVLAQPLNETQERMRDWLAANKRPLPRSSKLKGFREARLISQDADALIELDEKQRRHLEMLEARQMDFIRDVAHELRTPLTAIHGDAELLNDPELPPELHEKFRMNIIRESERLTRLTHDLTTLISARDDDVEAQREDIDLREAAELAAGSLSPILRDHEVEVLIEGDAPIVSCNPDKLEEVISNLIDNANRFVSKGGHIRIVLSEEAGNAVLKVIDDGPGFGDVEPRMLFERFYRTDFSRSRNQGGSGLGLAIVKGIVESYGGSVDAANLPEGGACFTVRIPAAQSE